MRLRDRIVDSPTSMGATMRARRWELLEQTFPQIEQLRILDLGGTTEFWLRVPRRPEHVTVVNLTEPGPGAEWITAIEGDACDPANARGEFDLVVSNSLIEHVGGHAQRARLADIVRSAAPSYWVQTPYRYFPVEPHWLFPGMQFAPLRLRAAIARSWPLAHTKAATREEAMQEVMWTELVSKSEMASLFPDATILFERMAGLPKSMVAIRR